MKTWTGNRTKKRKPMVSELAATMGPRREMRHYGGGGGVTVYDVCRTAYLAGYKAGRIDAKKAVKRPKK